MFNRNKFNQQLSDGDHRPLDHLGIAYFDINGLKKTNDLYGHRVGDDLIRRAADIIMSCFEGKAYRIGGDEFAVFARDALDENVIRNRCRQITARLAEIDSPNGYRISVSMGISF